MELSLEQLNDIRAAVTHYQHHQVSISNPRYKDYEVILQLLEKRKEENDCNYQRPRSAEHVGY